MEPFLPFLLATAVGMFLAGLTYLFARRSGLGTAQATLISTLQATSDALADQVKILQADLSAERDKRQALEGKVDRMESLIVDLVGENNDLRKKVGLPVRRVRAADMEGR